MVQITRKAKDPNRLTKVEICAILNSLHICNVTAESSKKELVGIFKKNKKQIESKQSEVVKLLKEMETQKKKDAASSDKKRKTPAKSQKKQRTEPEPGAEPTLEAAQESVKKPVRGAAKRAQEGPHPKEKTEAANVLHIEEKTETVAISHSGAFKKAQGQVPKAVDLQAKTTKKDAMPRQINKNENTATKEINSRRKYTQLMELIKTPSRMLILGVAGAMLSMMAVYAFYVNRAGALEIAQSIKDYVTKKGEPKPEKGSFHEKIELAKQAAEKELQAKKEEAAKQAHMEAIQRKRAEQEAKAKAEKEARERAEQEAKAKAEQEAKAKAEQEAKVKAEQEARERAEKEAKAKAEQEAKEKAEKEAKAKAEQEAKAKAEQEAKAKAEKEAKAKAEQKAKEKAEQEARVKAEQEAKAKAEKEARERAEQEARVKAEKEAKAKAEQEAKAKAEQEARERAEKEAKAKAQQEARVKAEGEARERAEQEAKAKAEQEAKAEKALPSESDTRKSSKSILSIAHSVVGWAFRLLFKLVMLGLAALVALGVVIFMLHLIHLKKKKIAKYRDFLICRIHKKSKNALPLDTIKEVRKEFPVLSSLEWMVLCNRILLNQNIRITRVLRGVKEEDAWMWVDAN
ncbi:uncharacterized protein NEMAJ01_1136 [Nematocida major]|uniref:uncharacterized protein n=1 Tax=Nematocida major TaxID=1912982 RepID=UPI00200815AA|nr:uncharacterized protein NEMAJ01_1136 [Nematocida major]KAH9386240.1 hypothetical protein NEMAJ01_1136 [Nematocida major]